MPRIRIEKKIVDKMDKAIKIKIEECGDFKEPDVFLARVIWNYLFNPNEKQRSINILDAFTKGKTSSEEVNLGILGKLKEEYKKALKRSK